MPESFAICSCQSDAGCTFRTVPSQLDSGIYAFALGIVLGYVCERGGSIYYSMGLHLLFNLWGTLSGFFPDPGNSVGVLVAVTVVTIVSLVTGFVLFNKGRRKRIVNQSLPEHPINSTGI